MQANTDKTKRAEYAGSMVCRLNRAGRFCLLKTGPLLILTAMFMMFLSLNGPVWASAQTIPDIAKNLDSRWLPWIGSWRLVSNTVNASDSNMDGMFLLKISPGDNRNSVVMTGTQDGLTLFDKKIVAAGSRRRVQEDNCTGWYEYSWSEMGEHLLFKGESTCADAQPQIITGISLFTSGRRWSDIQLMQSGEEKVITIRRYLAADITPENVGVRESAALDRGRIEASKNFSINEIIELSGKVSPEVIEAAIVELRKPFPINSKTLKRLDDAHVSPRIVDLMVAFTFPDRFTVEDSTIAPIERSASATGPAFIGYPYPYSYPYPYFYPWTSFGFWSTYDPFFPYYYYSSWIYWSNYGYWWNYPYYRPSYYPGGGSGIDRGRLIAGEGYSRVNSRGSGSGSRTARLRNSITRNSRGGSSGGYQRSAGSSSAGAPSGGSSGGYSGASSGSSGGGSPSASPGGYSSGGGGGGQAKQR
jgi:hypothetical protein